MDCGFVPAIERRNVMEWTWIDIFLVLELIGIVLVLLFFVWIVFFRNSTIYWDDKQQQIKTKGGKCVYDKNSADLDSTKALNFRHQLSVLEAKFANITELNKVIKEANEAIDSSNEHKAKLTAAHNDMKNDLLITEAQLQCGAKGHKMVYNRTVKSKWTRLDTAIENPQNPLQPLGMQINYTHNTGDFVFSCESCGLEITKTAKELTATEREALKKLKLL